MAYYNNSGHIIITCCILTIIKKFSGKMARKIKSLGLLTIFALLSNTNSGSCVQAELIAGQ